jgi:Fic family protein
MIEKESPFITKFLQESNAIEGVYDEDSLTQAQNAWNYLSDQKEISIHVMCRTHKILMLHQPLYPDEKGYLRKVTVFIGGHEGMNHRIVPTHLAKLAENMNDIVNNGQKEDKTFLENITKQHHVLYEKIHPFVDGNGRTGRMFMNWERLKVGLPLLIIHEGEEQQEYYKWFK